MAPMYQGSRPKMVFTVDQPATFSSRPRGIAMVTLAQMPWRLVRRGGAEYAHTSTLVKSTIQKHSRRPPGAASQARTQATSKVASVKPQASRMVSVAAGQRAASACSRGRCRGRRSG